jgi:hypothetical protein
MASPEFAAGPSRAVADGVLRKEYHPGPAPYRREPLGQTKQEQVLGILVRHGPLTAREVSEKVGFEASGHLSNLAFSKQIRRFSVENGRTVYAAGDMAVALPPKRPAHLGFRDAIRSALEAGPLSTDELVHRTGVKRHVLLDNLRKARKQGVITLITLDGPGGPYLIALPGQEAPDPCPSPPACAAAPSTKSPTVSSPTSRSGARTGDSAAPAPSVTGAPESGPTPPRVTPSSPTPTGAAGPPLPMADDRIRYLGGAMECALEALARHLAGDPIGLGLMRVVRAIDASIHALWKGRG